MSSLVSSVYIHAAPEEVWAALADFGNVYRFNPAVTASRATSDAGSGLGATRHCDLHPMGAVEERIIEWDEGASYTIDIYESQRLPRFRYSRAHLAVAPEGAGSRFTGTLDYQLRVSLMDRMGARRQFATAWSRFAAGLKHYVETGEEVSHPKGLPVEDVELAQA